MILQACLFLSRHLVHISGERSPETLFCHLLNYSEWLRGQPMKCCRDNLKANFHLCGVLSTEQKIRIKYHLLNQSMYARQSKPMNKNSLALYRILWISCGPSGAAGHGSLHFKQESLLFFVSFFLWCFQSLTQQCSFPDLFTFWSQLIKFH